MVRKLVVLGAVSVLIGAGCGDDGGEGGASAEAVEVASAEEVRTCLEDAGLEVAPSDSFTDEQREVLGIEEVLSLTGRDDLVGIGSVTWYVDASTASEAHEAGLEVRTDDVAAEVVGVVAWDYAGGDRAQSDRVGELISSCL